MTAHFTRRNALKGIATATMLGLAGCSDTTSSTTTTTTTPSKTSSDDTHTDEGHEEEDGNAHNSLPEHPEASAEVAMISTDSGEHFDPHVVWIETGGTVTWTNERGAHSATAYHSDNGGPLRQPEDTSSWDSGILSEDGARFEHTFDDPGVYQYYCTPHESMGMIAAVVVGEPDAHDQPGLKPPQDSFSDIAEDKLIELNEMCNEILELTH